ncbi:MAG TPA: DUF4142 domain-containing protein [Chitinophagales bacterium]|nr:DUF4142 domain-containing protein [Chitinophagales bacterium]
MKTLISKKLLVLCAAATLFAFGACNSGPKQEDTKEAAEEHNDTTVAKQEKNDAQFMVDAAAVNLKEIHVSEAALAHAMMAHTKQLAQMMIDDHQKAYNDLTSLAKSKNIAIPTNLTSGDISDSVKIADAKPKNVDEDYCDMMVSGHKDAIDKFQKEITDGVDADTKNWASSMLPGLQKHLDEAMKCQEECKKMDKDMK